MNRILVLLAVLLMFANTAVAQEPRSYSEGPVSVVTAVKVMDGQYENYINYLAKTYRPMLEAQKEAGIIVGYAIYDTAARRPDEPDLYLVVTYPNMASFDGLSEKTEPLSSKVSGMNRAQAAEASVGRGKMREIMGSEMIRQVLLK